MLTLSGLRYAQKGLRPRCVGGIEEVFALRWLETEHALPRERAVHQVAFGTSERCGVHAFALDTDRRTLVLLICSPSKNVSDFDTPLSVLAKSGIADLFYDATASSSPEALAALLEQSVTPGLIDRFRTQLHAVLDESSKIIETINIRLVFFGDPIAAAASAVVKHFEEDLLRQRHLMDARLGGSALSVTCTVKSADGSSSVPDKLRGYRHQLAMANHVRTEGPDGQVMHIGYIALSELLDMYRKLRIRFLARNVRAALNASTGSNQALSRAFLDVACGEVSPDLFLFRHNGVTLTASACEALDDALVLVEPQVLNGAQSVTTLDRVCERLKEKGEYTKAVEGRIGKIFVIGRVITNGSKDFVTSVTIASNRQNPIMPWHLRAHDDVQSLLQAWFSDHLGFYYEVQEGAFDAMTEEELESLGILEVDKCVAIKKLAQTYLATDGQVDKMQKLKTVFEDDAIYARTFCRGRMHAEPHDVVVCYKIERRIGKMLKLLGGGDKYAFAKAARSLIWALLCQAYLNDSRHERLAKAHGSHLVATGEFTEVVERLAAARVRPLLTWIANESDYRDDVKAERYGFLSSRKLFERSMQVGRERWGWTHRRLGSCS